MATNVMTTNEEIVRQWVDAAWNGGNLSIADEIYAPDYVRHDGRPEDVRGPASIKGLLGEIQGALPDIRLTIEDVAVSGDKVWWRFSATGTHTGRLFGKFPGTGKRATVQGLVVSRFANGLWSEDWVNWDALGMLQQLGLV